MIKKYIRLNPVKHTIEGFLAYFLIKPLYITNENPIYKIFNQN